MTENNDAELTLFLREIRSMALKYVQVRVSNEDIALDLLQDTMMGFVQAFERFEKDAWKNLFFKILNRRITDFLRKQTWRNRLVQMLTFSQLAGNKVEQPPEPEFVDTVDTESSLLPSAWGFSLSRRCTIYPIVNSKLIYYGNGKG